MDPLFIVRSSVDLLVIVFIITKPNQGALYEIHN